MTIRFLAAVALAAGPLTAPAAQAAEAPASVEASLSIGGVSTRLDHVLVIRQAGDDGVEDGPTLRIFLSDGPIPQVAASAPTSGAAKAYAQDHKVTGVVILADIDGRKLGGQAEVLNSPGLAEGSFATASNTEAFSRLSLFGGRLVGQASFGETDVKLQARFDAPISENPITSDLTGAAALPAPPTQAMLACTRALHSGDMAELARLYTAERMKGMAAFRAQVGEQSFHEQMKGAPRAEAVAQELKRTVVRGPNAAVMLTDGTLAELVLQDGQWKCN
jgi:hypothetical protein